MHSLFYFYKWYLFEIIHPIIIPFWFLVFFSFGFGQLSFNLTYSIVSHLHKKTIVIWTFFRRNGILLEIVPLWKIELVVSLFIFWNCVSSINIYIHIYFISKKYHLKISTYFHFTQAIQDKYHIFQKNLNLFI